MYYLYLSRPIFISKQTRNILVNFENEPHTTYVMLRKENINKNIFSLRLKIFLV